MEFKLNVPERLALLNLLPKEDNFINLRILRDAGLKIGFGDKESVEIELTQEGENIKFNAKKGMEEKSVEIGERAYSLICEALEKLDKEKKLIQQHLTLYEKFIEDKKTTDKTTDKKTTDKTTDKKD